MPFRVGQSVLVRAGNGAGNMAEVVGLDHGDKYVFIALKDGTIERKEWTSLEALPLTGEQEHRWQLWRRLADEGGPDHVSPTLLRQLGIYGGAQGVWVDKMRTESLTPDGSGVTVGLLHTGSSYADDLDEGGVIYHYPKTHRASGRDAAEVTATKTAQALGLPVFVIFYPRPNSNVRNVRLGWVEAWDDDAGIFLITFGEQPPELSSEAEPEAPFVLSGDSPRGRSEVDTRPGQARFRFQVIHRYGSACMVCDISVPELLDAAHIRPKGDHGSDDARNGLLLCASHHRAFDAGLFAIEPETTVIRCRPDGPGAKALSISRKSLAHLQQKPHSDALRWAWKRWTR
jgi:putative restriction endonuclease